MPRPKYTYWIDYDGGTILGPSLKEVCEKAREKFAYLEAPLPKNHTPDEWFCWNRCLLDFNEGYHRRNTFRRYGGYYGDLLPIRARRGDDLWELNMMCCNSAEYLLFRERIN